jgi:hypothetical protein
MSSPFGKTPSVNERLCFLCSLQLPLFGRRMNGEATTAQQVLVILAFCFGQHLRQVPINETVKTATINSHQKLREGNSPSIFAVFVWSKHQVTRTI